MTREDFELRLQNKISSIPHGAIDNEAFKLGFNEGAEWLYDLLFPNELLSYGDSVIITGNSANHRKVTGTPCKYIKPVPGGYILECDNMTIFVHRSDFVKI